MIQAAATPITLRRNAEPIPFYGMYLAWPENGKRVYVKFPFIREREDGERDYWAAEPTGNWLDDVETGEWYATLLLSALPHYPSLLGWVLADMGIADATDGIKTGFAGRIADALSPQRRAS